MAAISSIDERVRRAGWLAAGAAVLTVGLITYGAWVRASGSGLGCPDWPLCEGTVVPRLEGGTAIEFGHRLYAGVTTLTVAGAAWFAYLARRTHPGVAWLVLGAFAAILVQAGLGGLTVLTELHGMVRLAHLGTALLTLTLLTAGSLLALGVRTRGGPGLRIGSALLVGTAFVVLVGGAVVGAGVSAGCPGLPLCDERSGAAGAWLHGLHRVGAVLLLAALLWTAYRLRRLRVRGLAVALNHGAAFLMALQLLIGVLAVVQTLPQGLRVLHLGVATLVWWAVAAQWTLVVSGRRG